MAKLQLTEADVRALTELKWNGRTREERWRASVIVDCGKGLRRAEVAERNDCKIAGVDKTLMRFRGAGVAGLLSRRLKPHVRKVRQRGLDLLEAAIRQTPRTVCPDDPTFDRSLWTLALLRDYLVSQGVARVDDDTVRRYLLLLGWTTKSAKLRCSSPDPDYQEKMAAIEGLHEQFQPTYAPWTNPVERVWQEMRRWVTHGHGIPDFTELVRVADRWCRRFQADPAAARKLASFADADPCR